MGAVFLAILFASCGKFKLVGKHNKDSVKSHVQGSHICTRTLLKMSNNKMKEKIKTKCSIINNRIDINSPAQLSQNMFI